MKAGFWLFLPGMLLLSCLLILPPAARADEKTPCVDKEQCERMLRFGQEAYARGKYLDAKEFFRKAVQADPSSLKAWRYYDQAVLFGLAEKVEQNADLTFPSASRRTEGPPDTGGETSPPPPPPKPAMPAPPKPGEFRIMHDEGC